MSLEAAKATVVSHDFGNQMSESTPIWLADCLYDIRLGSAETEGRMSLTIIHGPPNNVIAPPHQHLDADELIYVLTGMLIVMVYHGDLETEVSVEEPEPALDPELFVSHAIYPGGFIWMPAGTIEAIFTTGHPMRAIFVFSPAGGSDEFFVNAGVPAKSRKIPTGQEYAGRPDIDILRKLSTEAEFQHIPRSQEADG